MTVYSTSSSIAGKHLYVRQAHKPHSVMVWTWISAAGRTPFILVPAGVKVDSVIYQTIFWQIYPFLRNYYHAIIATQSVRERNTLAIHKNVILDMCILVWESKFSMNHNGETYSVSKTIPWKLTNSHILSMNVGNWFY